MKRLGVFAVLVGVLALALAAGWLAADWPELCQRLDWCGADFPRVAPP
jgi:hypothetical protein